MTFPKIKNNDVGLTVNEVLNGQEHTDKELDEIFGEVANICCWEEDSDYFTEQDWTPDDAA